MIEAMVGLIIFSILSSFAVFALIILNVLLGRKPGKDFSSTPLWFLPAGFAIASLTFLIQLMMGFLAGLFQIELEAAILIGYSLTAVTQLALFVAYLSYGDRKTRQLLGAATHQFERNLIIGLQMGIVFSAFNIISLKISAELGVQFVNAQSLEATLYSSNSLTLLLIGMAFIGIIAPLIEEFLFRGLIYTGGRRLIGVWPSLLATAAFFTVLHGHAFPSLRFLMILFFGFFWGLCRERTGSLVGGLVCHIAVNLSMVVAGWNNGYVLKLVSWSQLGFIYLFLVMTFILFAVIKRVSPSLNYLLPQEGSPEEGQREETPLCPACATPIERDGSQRCLSCSYRFQHPSALIYFFEFLGALIITATASVGFILGSDYVQENAYVQTIKASSLQTMGRHEEAIDLLGRALEKNPTNETVIMTLAGIHYSSEEYDAAIDRALLLKDSSEKMTRASYHNLMALCLAEKGDELDLALEHALKARELSKNVPILDGSVEETYGWVLYCRGEHEKALNALDKATKMTTIVSFMGNLERTFHLAMVHRALGNQEKSRKLLLEVVKGGNESHSFVRRAKKALAEN